MLNQYIITSSCLLDVVIVLCISHSRGWLLSLIVHCITFQRDPCFWYCILYVPYCRAACVLPPWNSHCNIELIFDVMLQFNGVWCIHSRREVVPHNLMSKQGYKVVEKKYCRPKVVPFPAALAADIAAIGFGEAKYPEVAACAFLKRPWSFLLVHAASISYSRGITVFSTAYITSWRDRCSWYCIYNIAEGTVACSAASITFRNGLLFSKLNHLLAGTITACLATEHRIEFLIHFRGGYVVCKEKLFLKWGQTQRKRLHMLHLLLLGCIRTESQILFIHFHAGNCSANQFICDEFLCAPDYWVCNGRLNCEDKSDEQNCTYVPALYLVYAWNAPTVSFSKRVRLTGSRRTRELLSGSAVFWVRHWSIRFVRDTLLNSAKVQNDHII